MNVITNGEPTLETWLKRAVRSLTPSETAAWLMALVLFVGGDMATTALGLRLGAVESNPVALLGITELGLWPAMLSAKAVVVGWTVGCWHYSPDRYRIIFPIVLMLLGLGIVTWNTWVILKVL